MKMRIKFAKYGVMKFIGHLDVMRFFQKVFRRADIDIAFSEGMSPHMILSFAAPLGLGAEGMSEYADIQLNVQGPAQGKPQAENQETLQGKPQAEKQETLQSKPQAEEQETLQGKPQAEEQETLQGKPQAEQQETLQRIPQENEQNGTGILKDTDAADAAFVREMLERMNAASVEGIEFLDMRLIPDGRASKAMSLVTAADYAVRVREGHAPKKAADAETQECTEAWQQLWDRFLAQPSILIQKETKKGTKEADIRPMIMRIALDAPFELSAESAARDLQIHAATPFPVIYMRLATGSAANLKPEQVIDAFYDFVGYEKDPFAVTVTRLELYATMQDGTLCSLGAM